jgi:hypothetical protein
MSGFIRPDTAPAMFTNPKEQRTYQFPLMGESFQLDNQVAFRKLKAFLTDLSGWAWIKPRDAAENGRAA